MTKTKLKYSMIGFMFVFSDFHVNVLNYPSHNILVLSLPTCIISFMYCKPMTLAVYTFLISASFAMHLGNKKILSNKCMWIIFVEVTFVSEQNSTEKLNLIT